MGNGNVVCKKHMSWSFGFFENKDRAVVRQDKLEKGNRNQNMGKVWL